MVAKPKRPIRPQAGSRVSHLREKEEQHWCGKEMPLCLWTQCFVLFVLLSCAEDWTQSLSQARLVLFYEQVLQPTAATVFIFLITFMYVGRSTTGPSVEVRNNPLLSSTLWVLWSPGLVTLATPSPLSTPVTGPGSPQSLPHSVLWPGDHFLIPVMEYQALAVLSRSWDNCEAFGHCRQKPVLSERILGQSTNTALSHALRANCLFGKRGCLDLVS